MTPGYFSLPDLSGRYLRGTAETVGGSQMSVGSYGEQSLPAHDHALLKHEHDAGKLIAALQHADDMWRMLEVSSPAYEANGRVMNDKGRDEELPRQDQGVQVIGTTAENEVGLRTGDVSWASDLVVEPRHAEVNWVIKYR